MSIKIAINGFGRIGRMVFRCSLDHPDIEIAAINDLGSAEALAYLLKYDSVHGRFGGEVRASGNGLYINGREVKAFSCREPAALPWAEMGVEYVVESTGRFLTAEKAAGHIAAGARHVVMSAPPKDDTPVFVVGVNDDKYSADMKFVSCASCTTNCLAPVAKVLSDSFGIECGLMTTVHAYTATQNMVDGPSSKSLRAGRSAAQNIIPASTGAAKAIGRVLPELSGKLTGMAFRVPVADVSAVDLTVFLSRPAGFNEICAAMKRASECELKGILGYTDEPLVSSDFIGNRCVSVFDASSGIAIGDRFVKVVAWYDNETAYADKMLCLIERMHAIENSR